MAKFKYLVTTLTDQNSFHEENKSRLNSGDACYHSVQSLLSSRLLSRNVKVNIYKTIILPVSYGCETWSLTLREEHRLRLFENRVQRRIFGPKRDEVMENGGSCTMRSLIICTHPQISLGKSRRMRWAGHVARMGEERKVYKVFLGKPEGKGPLRRPRHRWEDGIRMNLREIGLGGVDWIRLAQGRVWWRAVLSAVMNLRVLAPRSWLVIWCYKMLVFICRTPSRITTYQ
jgi:hypothetical protein